MTTETNWAEQIGKPSLSSLREMVAALELDWDRLEELRDERDDWDETPEVPADFEVKELDDDDEAQDRATCNTCGRSWDDAIVTGRTPSPSARCPFEDFHPHTWTEANPDDAEELAELEKAAKPCGNECDDRDDAERMIHEDALSVEVRSGWVSVGDDMRAEEFTILLSTGGPAVRIRGELDDSGEPYRAWLEVQDWGKPWTEYYEPGVSETCLAYARCFTYGQ